MSKINNMGGIHLSHRPVLQRLRPTRFAPTFRDTTADFSASLFPTTATGDTTIWTYDDATGALLQKTYAYTYDPQGNFHQIQRDTIPSQLTSTLSVASSTNLIPKTFPYNRITNFGLMIGCGGMLARVIHKEIVSGFRVENDPKYP